MLLKVKNQEVADALIFNHNFKCIAADLDNILYLEPPSELSNSKARKLLQSHVKLHLARIDLLNAKNKYNKLVDEINKSISE